MSMTNPEVTSGPKVFTKAESSTARHLAFNGEVGRTLRRLRLTRVLTQAKLAELADISANYVARLERGELGPSLAVATRLSAALGVGPTELVEGFRTRQAGAT